jgi:hypothetical protein
VRLEGQLSAVGPHQTDVQVIEATHAFPVQPAEERPHHAVVVKQGLVSKQRALALQPEVLVPGLDRRAAASMGWAPLPHRP